MVFRDNILRDKVLNVFGGNIFLNKIKLKNFGYFSMKP